MLAPGEPVGFIPLGDCDTTTELICDCVKCDACRAARALQTGDINCRLLASVDADLLSVVLAWENLWTDPKGHCRSRGVVLVDGRRL